jgi:hypothetical protein
VWIASRTTHTQTHYERRKKKAAEKKPQIFLLNHINRPRRAKHTRINNNGKQEIPREGQSHGPKTQVPSRMQYVSYENVWHVFVLLQLGSAKTSKDVVRNGRTTEGNPKRLHTQNQTPIMNFRFNQMWNCFYVSWFLHFFSTLKSMQQSYFTEWNLLHWAKY